MKRLLCFLGAVVFSATAYAQADTDIVNIPDTNFKNALIASGVDTNNDNEINYGEARAVTRLNISRWQISNLTGIEAFSNLTVLECFNNNLTSLDVSSNTNLEALVAYRNQLTGIILSPSIQILNLGNNLLTSIDVSVSPNLKWLYLGDNQLSAIDVSQNTALTILGVAKNQLTSVNVSANTLLTELNCSDNQITSLDLSTNTRLSTLFCWNNQLTSLDVSNNVYLGDLGCGQNQLTSLDVSHNIRLVNLGVADNFLTSIDLSNNLKLEQLSITNNPISTLNVDQARWLKTLRCSHTQLSVLDLSVQKPSLYEVRCTNTPLTQLNLANNNVPYLHLKLVDARNNPSLACIQIDSGFTPPPPVPIPGTVGWWQKDATATYSDNCNYPTASTQEVTSTHHLTAVSPMGDTLILKGDAKIQKVEIYSTAGQLVKVLLDHDRDVSALSKGVYFLKITTNKGIETIKVIK